MHELQIFAPYALFILNLLITLKIFARSEELAIMKAELLQYVNETFVKENTYTSDHESLKAEISQIRQDISEVKNLLIGLAGNRNIKN